MPYFSFIHATKTVQYTRESKFNPLELTTVRNSTLLLIKMSITRAYTFRAQNDLFW